MTNIEEILSFITSISATDLFQPAYPSLDSPESIQGDCAKILKDDLNNLLFRWFVDSIKPFDDCNELPYPYVYNSVRRVLDKRFPSVPSSEIISASLALSKIAKDSDLAEKRKTYWPVKTKSELLSRAKGRCKICGYKFDNSAIDRFLLGSSILLRKSQIYDCLKPTRMSTWHSKIYIDHIRPVSRGGSNNIENLQTLCGFCNSSKKDFITIFDQSHTSGPVIIEHPKIRSSIHLSSWFLVVRMLAGGKCNSCGEKADKTELTVAPMVLSRTINPSNILVTCYICDELKRRGLRYLPTPDSD